MKQQQRPDDFIMNPKSKPGKVSQLDGLSKRKRLMLAAAAGAGLLLVFGIIFSLLLGGGGESTAQQTLKLAQQHKETLRIAEIGIKKSRSSEVRNLATTVKLTLQSTENQIVAIAQKDQEKVTNSQLSAGKNTKTDEALVNAEQNNRFDEKFKQTIYSHIEVYLQQLKIVYNASDSKSDKQVLDNIYSQLYKILPSQTNSSNTGV